MLKHTMDNIVNCRTLYVSKCASYTYEKRETMRLERQLCKSKSLELRHESWPMVYGNSMD